MSSDKGTHLLPYSAFLFHACLYVPPIQKSSSTAEVAEESDGWFRLRTVTTEWDSEEEEDRKIKLKVHNNGERGQGARVKVHMERSRYRLKPCLHI